MKPAPAIVVVSAFKQHLPDNPFNRLYRLSGVTSVLQIFSTEQWATMIVHSYPFFPALESALESTAAARNEPGMQEILSAARTHPMTDDLLALDDYISFVTSCYRHEYVPVFRFTAGSSAPVHSTEALPSRKPEVRLRDMMLY